MHEELRRGYYLGIINQRGVHWIDPEGKPELELAEDYENKANIAESRGYSRYAGILRGVADEFKREAKSNILEAKNGKKEMISLLKSIFGYKFFDFTLDEMNDLEEKGMFTRNKLGEIFKDVVGIKDGKVVNLPKTWEELVDLLSFIIEKIDDKTTTNQDRNGYLHSLVTIENLVAANYKDLMSLLYAEEQLLKNIDDVCQKYKAKKIIKMDNPDEFKELLNHGMMKEKIDENGNKRYEEVGFGDLTIKFIETYNGEINRVNNLKNREIEVNRAFKKLKSKNLDDLEYSDFPDLPMDKELYVGLKSKIDKYVCSKKNDKKDLTHLVPLLDMYYYYSDCSSTSDKKQK